MPSALCFQRLLYLLDNEGFDIPLNRPGIWLEEAPTLERMEP